MTVRRLFWFRFLEGAIGGVWGTGVVRRRAAPGNASAGELWGRARVSSITGFAEPYVHPETPDPPKALTS